MHIFDVALSDHNSVVFLTYIGVISPFSLKITLLNCLSSLIIHWVILHNFLYILYNLT